MASKKSQKEQELFTQYQADMRAAGLEPSFSLDQWTQNYRDRKANVKKPTTRQQKGEGPDAQAGFPAN